MEENSRARNVYVNKMYAESGCKVLGEIQYTEVIEKEESVQFV
jgi:hypothetical protein